MGPGAGRALLLLDLQNDVVDPSGALAPAPESQAAVDRALERSSRALAWARETSIPVAHVAVRFRPGHPEIDRGLPLFAAVHDTNALVEGTRGGDFHPSVAPCDGEWVVAKRGVDAFAGTDLAIVLRRAGVRDLYLAGVSTNLVVLGTAFTSIDHGFRPIIVTDACASSASPGAHDAALELSRPVAAAVTVDDLR